jgi:hypothetical protein
MGSRRRRRKRSLSAEERLQILPARLLEHLVQLPDRTGLGDGNEVAAPEPADVALDPPFSCAPRSPGRQNEDSKP